MVQCAHHVIRVSPLDGDAVLQFAFCASSRFIRPLIEGLFFVPRRGTGDKYDQPTL